MSRQNLVRLSMLILIPLTFVLGVISIAAPSWVAVLPVQALAGLAFSVEALYLTVNGVKDSTYHSSMGRLYLVLAALTGPAAFGLRTYVFQELFVHFAGLGAALILVYKANEALGRRLCTIPEKPFKVATSIIYLCVAIGVILMLPRRFDSRRPQWADYITIFLITIYWGLSTGHGEAVAAAKKLQSPQD